LRMSASVETRRRNSVLQALEAMRSETSRGTNPFVRCIVYLYVAENEGVTVTELAEFCRYSVSYVAKLVNEISAPDSDGAAPLLKTVRDENVFRVKYVYLSDHGAALADKIDGIIAEASLIHA